MLKAKLYLDTRRPLKDGRYPLKLHVFENSDVRTYYPTGEKLTEAEWGEVKSHSTRSRELKSVLARIVQYQAKALTIIESDKYLDLQQFDALFRGRITRSLLVKALYEEKIKDLVRRGQYGTHLIYTSAMNLWEEKRPGLTLDLITKEFLLDLENELDIAPSTKGIYLRTLRTIYNLAIDRKIIPRDAYPFGGYSA